MDNLFYTYAYLREDGTPYYIGKGKDRRAYDTQRRRVKVPPKDRILILKKNLTEEEAFRHEVYMIALYGRKDLGTGILWNFTDGGEGASGAKRSEETRKKMSLAQKGWKRKSPSAETRKKVSEALKACNHPNRQGLSDEHKRKVSESQKKRLAPPEVRAKMSIASSGERNPFAAKWRITFSDGRIIERWGLSNWAKENGYSSSSIAEVAAKRRKKHKDIIAVEKLESKRVR